MNSPETRAVQPVGDARVRHPVYSIGAGAVLAPGGETVVWDSYWARRLADCDIEPVKDTGNWAAGKEKTK